MPVLSKSQYNVDSTVPVPASPDAGLSKKLVADAREFVSFCRRENRWLFCMLVFVLVWTIELYIVQAKTLTYSNENGPRFDFWAPKIRFVLDLLFISAWSLWLRRRWLVVMVIGSFFAYLGLLTYWFYFMRPLSLNVILTTWRESLELRGFAAGLFPKSAAVGLLLTLVVKLTALGLSRKVSLPRNCARLAGGALALAYAGLYAAILPMDPLSAIQSTRGVGRLGEIRGYLGPWLAELYYLRNDQILQRALARREVKYDRLTPIEANIPVHKHLVILQAESLDTNILGYRVKGQEVTPFLNALRDQSMFYRVRIMHFNGSADADFVALNAVPCSDRENTYTIPGYPYQDTTPQLLAHCGFETFSFHGNSGSFYERRSAFEKMGFTKFFFEEELEGQYGLKGDPWGVRDRDVLSLSAQLLRTASAPTFHFVITLTTHVPYTLLTPAEEEIYPAASTVVERYINNMRYLDNCLRDYITSLGHGTTVMIYADHPTEEGEGDFLPDRVHRGQFVPCFVYDTDQDLSRLQKTRHDPRSTDGTWNLIDVINYLRAQVARSFPAPHAGTQADKAGKARE